MNTTARESCSVSGAHSSSGDAVKDNERDVGDKSACVYVKNYRFLLVPYIGVITRSRSPVMSRGLCSFAKWNVSERLECNNIKSHYYLGKNFSVHMLPLGLYSLF